MVQPCPFLTLSGAELMKVKPEFRAEVKQDAEKCIEGECANYVDGLCNASALNPVMQIRIGGLQMGSYLPEHHMISE